mmetsp:Transcript_27011/g.37297  ORF Transcript_27011/g.37297 Transcript_27011/m.37297 type:complete len:225 (-) Transcript_27011:137-811(-)|eukprot:CAMPEP_0196579236 /NCGR_PEP_ID=MMETSP1081-20130531/19683_1 /TAXON_ID=36882 /ORGANISM="Pyramimonas amylifera, Strain CCMP720" /LENGTH=224 /DNA_ID=CAMNT_0041898753 /DNA_START=47 /DNA_END=721 /DNA_ORIENTATION=-
MQQALSSSNISKVAAFSAKAGSKRTSKTLVCKCSAESKSVSTRRTMLSGLSGVLVLGPTLQSFAGPIGLAGESVKVCDPGEEGADCRKEELGRDFSKGVDYDAAAANNSKSKQSLSATAKPQDKLYVEMSEKLIEKVETYTALGVYDKQRPVLVAELQKEGNYWVSLYAPGGSSKKESGRAFYVALDALLGHIAFNGLAPMRGTMVSRINDNCEKARDLIAQGK